MQDTRIQLDGDPRKLAMAIFRAAKQTCQNTHGRRIDRARMLKELETEIPELARQMVESLERDARDIYLINALEVLALTYAKQQLKTR